MRSKRPRLIQVIAALPLRDLLQRASLGLMASLGLLLLVLSKTNPAFVSSVRMTITGAVLPAIEVVASPVEAVTKAVAMGREWVAMRSELAVLKAENAGLRRDNLNLRQMEAENKALRELFSVVPGGQARYITARLVADSAGPFMNAALITGGRDDGVAKNQAVVNAQGLVGRVVEAGKTSSRVLLLTDVNSKVPVMGELSREKAILTGDNSPQPTLSYLSNDVRLKAGETILTSGDGGLFPPGIPVGVVTSVERGDVRVRPLVDFRRLEYVTVVEYKL